MRIRDEEMERIAEACATCFITMVAAFIGGFLGCLVYVITKGLMSGGC